MEWRRCYKVSRVLWAYLQFPPDSRPAGFWLCGGLSVLSKCFVQPSVKKGKDCKCLCCEWFNPAVLELRDVAAILACCCSLFWNIISMEFFPSELEIARSSAKRRCHICRCPVIIKMMTFFPCESPPCSPLEVID